MPEDGGLDQLASRLERGKRTPPTPRRPRPGDLAILEDESRSSPQSKDQTEVSMVADESFRATRESRVGSAGAFISSPITAQKLSSAVSPAAGAPPSGLTNESVEVPNWGVLARQLAGAPTSALTVRIRAPLADMLERVVYQARENGDRISRVELTELALLELSSLDTAEVVRKVRMLRQVAERRGG